MALTVALVRILNPDGESNGNAVFLASAYYSEDVRRRRRRRLWEANIVLSLVACCTPQAWKLAAHPAPCAPARPPACRRATARARS